VNNTKIVKALSIKNPWAWLIAKGIKPVENRSWKTTFRGRIYIHVSKKWDGSKANYYLPITEEQWITLSESVQNQLYSKENMPTGAIIGEVDIIDCVKGYDSIWSVEGQYQWVLDNPIMYNYVIPDVKGKLSFWNYDVEK